MICADKTPWTAVLEAGGGEVIESLTPASLGQALNRWASMMATEIVAARTSSAAAYREWSATQPETNVIKQVLLRLTAGT